jgi:hypothetical protein
MPYAFKQGTSDDTSRSTCAPYLDGPSLTGMGFFGQERILIARPDQPVINEHVRGRECPERNAELGIMKLGVVHVSVFPLRKLESYCGARLACQPNRKMVLARGSQLRQVLR